MRVLVSWCSAVSVVTWLSGCGTPTEPAQHEGEVRNVAATAVPPDRPVSSTDAAPTDHAAPEPITLWACFADASGLPVGARVVVAGLPVGEVAALRIKDRRGCVAIGLRVDLAVWSNAILIKKASSTLGESYLELEVGSEAAGSPEHQAATRLVAGDEITHVVEDTSVEEVRRRIDATLPRVAP